MKLLFSLARFETNDSARSIWTGCVVFFPPTFSRHLTKTIINLLTVVSSLDIIQTKKNIFIQTNVSSTFFFLRGLFFACPFLFFRVVSVNRNLLLAPRNNECSP